MTPMCYTDTPHHSLIQIRHTHSKFLGLHRHHGAATGGGVRKGMIGMVGMEGIGGNVTVGMVGKTGSGGAARVGMVGTTGSGGTMRFGIAGIGGSVSFGMAGMEGGAAAGSAVSRRWRAAKQVSILPEKTMTTRMTMAKTPSHLEAMIFLV
ncbi:unnamed protein product [Musa hybrid cultivar]